ncbi:MAG: TonB-dependent receptor [Acidobacteria bacterium]|nr:TonB-dependent receptor [Acidobacteriota bacterium]
MNSAMKSVMAAGLVLLTWTAAPGQSTTGTITGTVTDPGGAVIPGASLTITNTASNVATRVTTSAEGVYVAPGLLPGSYQVAAAATGFGRSTKSGIQLEINQTAQVNIRLVVSGAEEVVEVSAAELLLQTEQSSVDQTVEKRLIEDLPLVDQNVMQLVQITPGVVSGNPGNPQAVGLIGNRSFFDSNFSVNGGRASTNDVLVDGVANTIGDFNGVGATPPARSVQEFKVQTNTMSAEYGFTLGGVVNLVTKSGTNEYHGTLYEFLRNNWLDANSWSNNRAQRSRQPLRYNQYGGSIGGPLRLPKRIFGPLGGFDGRDRTFFFYNYEGYQFVTNASGFYTMPTEAFRNGDFSKLADANGRPILIYDPATTRPNPNGQGFLRDPFPGNIIPSNRIDPVAKNILRFYPLANRTADNAFTNLNNYFGAVSNRRTLNNHTSRFDHRVTDRNTFSVRYTFYRQFTDNGTANLYPDPVVRQRTDPFRGHNVVLTDLHNFTPNLIHETRIGVARQIFDFKVASAGGAWPQQLGLPAMLHPMLAHVGGPFQ